MNKIEKVPHCQNTL